MEPFIMLVGDGSHVFTLKDPNGNTENEVSMTLYTPTALHDDINSCTNSL